MPVQDKVFPFRSALPAEDVSAPVPSQDADSPAEPLSSEDDTPAAIAHSRLKLSEQRLQVTLDALQAASVPGASLGEIQRWEQAYEDEMRVYEVADATYCRNYDSYTQ